jgi:6-phosphogluconolactonase
MSERTIVVLPDAKALAIDAAERIVALANDAVAARGIFSIALSGGSTPKALFELFASDEFVRRIDWPHWEIYFGDERCVPPAHKDSNFKMASEAMLDHVPINPDHIHRMKGEIDPQQAAIEYGQLLKEKFGDGGLDLILLGMGDDGHTASLFPGTKALDETKHRCVANFVPRMNVWRITLSAPFINRARVVMILISGAAKAQRLQQVLEGPRDPKLLPIQLIEPSEGQLLWLLDADAAGMTADKMTDAE